MTKRVVIIEDDHIQSIALKLLLDKSGYLPVAICRTGESAVHTILEEKPDLIVSDIYLGDDLDGISVINETRKKHISPVVFITGQSRYEIEPRIENLEKCVLLGKPITLQELQKAIHAVASNESE